MGKDFNHIDWSAKTSLLFLLTHMLSGIAGGFVLGALFLFFNINNLWTLISHSKDGFLVAVMFFTGLAITFGSIGMGWGIFSLGQERDDPPEDDNTPYY